MSLREALNGHRNSLGILRLVLAASVIFDHSFPLGGWGEAPFLGMTRNQQSLGGVAVLGFFAISGYLVTKSAQSADALQFVWRRFLRIFPGFWFALLVGAFVVGPIFWVLERHQLGTYLSLAPGGPVAYLYENALLHIGQYGVWDIFSRTTPFGLAGNGGPINGSIWTLIYEFTCYLMLTALLLFGILRRAKIAIPAIAGFFLILQILNLANPGASGTIVPFLGDYWRVNFGLIFFIGSTIALYSDKIPFSNAFGILTGVFSVVSLRLGGFNTLGYIAFAYFVLYLAARLPASFQRVGAKNDYSYGVYLYGWIAGQVLAFFGVQRWGYLPYALITLVAASALAFVSWHLVEKWAMRLKDWGPGRGYSGIVQRVRAANERLRRSRLVRPPVAAVAPTTTESDR